MTEPSKTVHNERIKLTATLLNGVGIACMVAGVVTPMAALTFGFGSYSRHPAVAALFALVWLFVGAILHYGARRFLGGLRE